MNNKIRIFSAIIILVCSVSILLITKNKSTEQITTAVSVSQYEIYMLKDYCGKIAVFKGENATPQKIYDIFTNTLPEQDYTMLKHGIEVKDEKELTKLINDYTS